MIGTRPYFLAVFTGVQIRTQTEDTVEVRSISAFFVNTDALILAVARVELTEIQLTIEPAKLGWTFASRCVVGISFA